MRISDRSSDVCSSDLHWQAKNDRVIFQVETWFMFHYWMRRGLASTSPRKPKGVTRGRPPHGRVFMRPFARPLRRAILATSALSLIAFVPTAFAQEPGATDADANEIIVTARRRDESHSEVPEVGEKAYRVRVWW